MPEPITQGETPATETATVTEPAAPAASAEELARKLQNKTEEAERLHKKVEKFEADEVARQKAAMTETERLQKERDEATTELARLRHEKEQRAAADKVGLPATFADRLKGATPEELEADAKSLLDSMPKSQQPTAPKLPPTNPPNAEQVETDAQKRERIYGKRVNPFDMDTIRAQGGGVVWPQPPTE